MSTSSCECVSRPARLSNICWTVSVCSLSSENPDTPLHSASLRGWGSDRRFSTRHSVGWSGAFSDDTRTDLGSVLPPREVPVWCYSQQELPSCLPLFLTVFISHSVCLYFLFLWSSCHCHSLSLPFFTPSPSLQPHLVRRESSYEMRHGV